MGVVLKINTRQSDTGDVIRTVKFFNRFRMELKYDAIGDTFAFDFFFDPNNAEHAEVACVSHYHECAIYYDEELLINGYMLSQDFNDEPAPLLVTISGYSKSGVFEDCDIPTNMYPLESNGLSFRQICQRILNEFNTHIKSAKNKFKLIISDVASSSAGKSISQKVDTTIPKSTAKESENIKSYWSNIATQQNLVLSHSPSGDLLITQASTSGDPIFDLDVTNPDNRSAIGYIGMSLSFNGQQMHSHITVIRQASKSGGNAAEYTIRNPFVPVAAVFRPRVIVLSSGDDITIQEAAENELRKELKNIRLIIRLDRGKINGKFIRPNNVCRVKNRNVFLYNPVRWFIEGVTFDVDADKEQSVLTCVPTFVYSKEEIKNFFVNSHENLPRI